MAIPDCGIGICCGLSGCGGGSGVPVDSSGGPEMSGDPVPEAKPRFNGGRWDPAPPVEEIKTSKQKSESSGQEKSAVKRIWIYALVIAAALAFPVDKTDVGSLQPVEVVHLYQKDEKYVLETDTGDLGMGDTIKAAMEDLAATVSGTVFLDTAEYLLLEKEMVEQAKRIAPYLKKKVRVCEAERGLDLKAAAQYLSAHAPKSTLKELLTGTKLETLRNVHGRLILK